MIGALEARPFDGAVDAVDVVTVGAGLSAIGAACHLSRRCPGKSFVLLESRDTMGGTWDLFRNPGLRSDSDMYTLGYNFKPWPGAKSIADGSTIFEYAKASAVEYGVDRYIRFGHRLAQASWSSSDGKWSFTTERADGSTSRLDCRFLLLCAGYYSYAGGNTPHFSGRERFAGSMVHPQQWPEDLDYRGKKVVVIGSGATAVTVVPVLALEASHVVMPQRSPTCMLAAPAIDRIALLLRRLLPAGLAHRLTRWKSINLQRLFFRIEGFNAGYIKRLLPLCPRQGDHAPWTSLQDYAHDKKVFRHGALEDGVLQFTHPAGTRQRMAS